MVESNAMRATLDALVAERDELNVLIAGLAKRLGMEAPGTGLSTEPTAPLPGGNPVDGTHEAEYFGFPSTKAAGEVLKKFGSRQRPLKTKDLYDAVRKGGVDISGEDALYRSLARSRHFRKVGRGLWGLSEWYPPRSGKPARPEAPNESDDGPVPDPEDDAVHDGVADEDRDDGAANQQVA